MKKLKLVHIKFMLVFSSLLISFAPFSSIVEAAGPSIPRLDRPGEVIAMNDGDLNFQVRFADYYPELEGLKVTSIDAVNQPYYTLQNGDVWVYDDPTSSYKKVTTLSNVKNITSSGDQTYFALKNDGTVWSWGCTTAIIGRVLSDPSDCTDSSIGQITELSGITKIAVGNTQVLALKSDGTVWAWGDNYYGSVGTDPTVTETTHGLVVPRPVQVGLPGVTTSIASGSNYSMALLSNGALYEWGQVAIYPSGTWTLNAVPTEVSSLVGVAAIASDANAAFALKSNGQLWAWGRNDQNQLAANGTPLPTDGDGVAYTSIPIHVNGLPLMQEIQSDNHSAFIGRSINDDLWIWGHNLAAPTNIPNSTGAGAYYYNSSLVQYVRPVGPQLLSVSASPSPMTISKGSQQQLTVTANYSDTSNQDVTSLASYISNNAGVASVDGGGSITGSSTGQASITVSYNNKTTTIDVTVTPIAPQPPTNLNLVNGSSAGRLNLNWTPPSDNGGSLITNYLVFRRTGTNPFTQVASVNTTSFADSNLATGVVYEYYVKAVNNVGPSIPSAVVSKQAPGLFGNPICILSICI